MRVVRATVLVQLCKVCTLKLMGTISLLLLAFGNSGASLTERTSHHALADTNYFPDGAALAWLKREVRLLGSLCKPTAEKHRPCADDARTCMLIQVSCLYSTLLESACTRYNSSCKLHVVLCLQVGGRDMLLNDVLQYWRQKRHRWKKPLLRRLQAPTSSNDTNPYNVFR